MTGDPTGEHLQPAEDPPSPVAPSIEMAIGLHVLFQSMKAAGFSDYQACVIIGTFMAVGGTGGVATAPEE